MLSTGPQKKHKNQSPALATTATTTISLFQEEDDNEGDIPNVEAEDDIEIVQHLLNQICSNICKIKVVSSVITKCVFDTMV